MENNLKFNSAICTSRVQSERLIALGLKKETADCFLMLVGSLGGPDLYTIRFGAPYDGWTEGVIPAWSLHRLLSMLPDNAPRTFWILDGANISIEWDNDGTDFFPHKGNMYDGLIDCIEWLIKEGYFPKEYLV